MSTRTLNLTDRLYDYLLGAALRETEVQRRLREATRGIDGAEMQIAPEQAQLMGFAARLMGARRAIEIGTFTGYSALAVALALPEDGKLICCDINHETTSVARRFWAEARVAAKIDLRLGPARETLDALLVAGGEGSFDLAFIDADKPGYDGYYERCLRLLRPGGLAMIDNMLWGGTVADARRRDASTQAIRALTTKIRDDERVDMCLVPIGDGLMLARKR